MKKILRVVLLFAGCLLLAFGGMTKTHAKAILNDAESLEASERYVTPSGFFDRVTLTCVYEYNGYKTYAITVHYTATDTVRTISINRFKLTNGNGTLYYQANNIYYPSVNQGDGEINVGGVYLPASITTIYGETSNGSMYFDLGGWTGVDDLNIPVVFN